MISRGGYLRRLPPSQEEGSISVLLVALVGIAVLALVGFARLGVMAIYAERAQRAADTASLAGAHDLRDHTAQEVCARARNIASANGSILTSCEIRGWAIAVRVRYRWVERSAAAAVVGVP